MAILTVAVLTTFSTTGYIVVIVALFIRYLLTRSHNQLTAVLRMAAGEVDTEVERPESDAERKKAEEKAAATDIAKHISEALDKIDDQIRKTLDEAQELVKA